MSPIEVLRTKESWIQKTQGVCGGDACIRNTRVPVWSVVVAQRLGATTLGTKEELQDYFVTPLSAADVEAAGAYYEQHRAEIEEEIRQNEEA